MFNIQCVCGHSYDSYDDEDDSATLANDTNLCQWEFHQDSYGNSRDTSLCGQHLLLDALNAHDLVNAETNAEKIQIIDDIKARDRHNRIVSLL